MTSTPYTSESKPGAISVLMERTKQISLALKQWIGEVKKIDEAVKDLDARFTKTETELKHEIEILKHDLPVQEDTWMI